MRRVKFQGTNFCKPLTILHVAESNVLHNFWANIQKCAPTSDQEFHSTRYYTVKQYL